MLKLRSIYQGTSTEENELIEGSNPAGGTIFLGYSTNMTMPKKGTKLLQVDDISYRCRIRSLDSYSDRITGFSADTLRVTIQQDVDRPGRVLQIEVGSKVRKEDPEEAQHCGDYLKASLKPSALQKIIKTGLQQGWNPLEKGAAFQITGSLDLGDYCRGTI